jgi:tRNA threonylcarbamoyladenosine biosynthesis protein TsaE
VDHHLTTVDTGVENAGASEPLAALPALRLLWPDEAATRSFAQTLAQLPELGQAFITLHGDLGAGKTTFARHLLQALGVSGRIKSPTYAIVEAYESGTFPIWHFDFYRFNDAQEWEDAGFRDIFASPGLKLAEWPQKAESLLPLADLDMAIETPSESARSLTLRSSTPLGATLLQGLASRLGAAPGSPA